MDKLEFDISETGGTVSVPIDAIIGEDDKNFGDLLRARIKEEGEKVGKSKVRLNQTFDEESMSYQVAWEWMD